MQRINQIRYYMKYLLINSNGHWSIENVQRGSAAESRLVARLALHVCGHSLVCNTPNYLVESILEYSNHTLQYTITKYLRAIQIDGNFNILFMFQG